MKLLTKKSIESGEDCDNIPESMRQYLAMQAMESGKPLVRDFLGRSSGLNRYGSGGLMINAEPNTPGKVGEFGLLLRFPKCTPDLRIVIHYLSCKSLTIGTWRRVGQNAMDLVIFYAPDKACITYYINNDSAGYKIEFPFSYIKSITLENAEGLPEDPLGMPVRPPGLMLELNRPPNFFMDTSGTGGFSQCGDFTEDQQASKVMSHYMGGHPRVLSGQLAKLVSLETYQNRHGLFDPTALSVPLPISPIPRPASQPNQMSHPHLALFQENPFGMNLHPGHRGHKRTRSRSVPAAIDFSLLQSPMPSFHIQRPSVNMTDANIYAPIPQHHNNLGPNLRIDTTSSYGLDFRPYPMSAATTTSPSDYASPQFYTTGAHMDSIPATSFNPSYSLPFLSPMVEHRNMIHPSVSPLSTISQGDPVIAGQSPPLSNMHRSPSAEFLTISQEHRGSMSDDGLLLSEMYSKQNLNLPMHSPSVEDMGMAIQMHEESSSEEMDLHNLVSYGTIDPSSLSPENIGM